MTFIYIITAYIAGIFTVIFIIFANAFAENMRKEIDSLVEDPPPEHPQAVQFIDPLPPEEILKNIDVNKLEIHD